MVRLAFTKRASRLTSKGCRTRKRVAALGVMQNLFCRKAINRPRRGNKPKGKKMKKNIVAMTLALGLASGCSSIISKSDYAVAVNSSPDGANFSITNKAGLKVQSGVTPSIVTLKSSSGYFKGEAYTIELKKDGYSSKTFTLSSTVDGWYFGNILFGGLIGMLIVDPATGAMYNLPARADVSLDPQTSSLNNQQSFKIATIENLSAEERSRLEKVN